jgi:hypothetical protein
LSSDGTGVAGKRAALFFRKTYVLVEAAKRSDWPTSSSTGLSFVSLSFATNVPCTEPISITKILQREREREREREMQVLTAAAKVYKKKGTCKDLTM